MVEGFGPLGRSFQLILESFAVLATWAVICAAGTSAAEPTDQKTPLWSFAWVTDMHLDDSLLDYTAGAFRHIDEQLKPHFVVITGDNNAIAPPPTDPKHPEPQATRRQLFLKDYLGKNLKTPYAIIPGDNWPEDFDRVFGPRQYSFDCGGLHFLMLAPDRAHKGHGREGLSVFDQATLDWIVGDLERHRAKPTIAAIHEPIVPPTFLDAPRLREILDRHPQVVAVLQGHLHVDMDRRRRETTYLVGPALGRPPRRAMKLVEVHPDSLVVRTIVHQAAEDRFEMQSRRQEIPIAESLRVGLSAPTDKKFTQSGYDSLPARPLVDDPALADRAGELMKNAAGFLLMSQ